MKIGILTQPLHANYGGLLQNYALQQTLIKAGYEVETVDWEGLNKGLHESLYRLKMQMLHALFPNRYPQMKYRPSAKERAIIQRNTNHFINIYILSIQSLYIHMKILLNKQKKEDIKLL